MNEHAFHQYWSSTNFVAGTVLTSGTHRLLPGADKQTYSETYSVTGTIMEEVSDAMMEEAMEHKARLSNLDWRSGKAPWRKLLLGETWRVSWSGSRKEELGRETSMSKGLRRIEMNSMWLKNGGNQGEVWQEKSLEGSWLLVTKDLMNQIKRVWTLFYMHWATVNVF